MIVEFRGWQREIKQHSHEIQPVDHSGSGYETGGAPGEPLTWDGPLHALGKIRGLGLTGDFLVDFRFRREELENWLRKYVQAEPEFALRLACEIQAEATVALAARDSGPRS